MKKDAARDYATNAFRMYATLSKKARIKLCEKNPGSPVANDIAAVDAMFDELKKTNNGDLIEKAVKAVYFHSSRHSFARGLIAERVKKVHKENYVSEIQIYRYLRYARNIFCNFRGLCTEADIALVIK